jgi:hypothetical protein
MPVYPGAIQGERSPAILVRLDDLNRRTGLALRQPVRKQSTWPDGLTAVVRGKQMAGGRRANAALDSHSPISRPPRRSPDTFPFRSSAVRGDPMKFFLASAAASRAEATPHPHHKQNLGPPPATAGTPRRIGGQPARQGGARLSKLGSERGGVDTARRTQHNLDKLEGGAPPISIYLNPKGC